jgi:hypothetical protein
MIADCGLTLERHRRGVESRGPTAHVQEVRLEWSPRSPGIGAAIRTGMTRTPRDYSSVKPTHARGRPDVRQHLAGNSAADGGPQERVSRRHESTSSEYRHQPPDLRPDTADLRVPVTQHSVGGGAVGLPCLPDLRQQPPGLRKRVAGSTSRYRGMTDRRPLTHDSDRRQVFRRGLKCWRLNH